MKEQHPIEERLKKGDVKEKLTLFMEKSDRVHQLTKNKR